RPRNCQAIQRETPCAAGTTARLKPRKRNAGAAKGASESDDGAAMATSVTMIELAKSHFIGRATRPRRRRSPPKNPQTTSPMQTARSVLSVAQAGQSPNVHERKPGVAGRAGIVSHQ